MSIEKDLEYLDEMLEAFTFKKFILGDDDDYTIHGFICAGSQEINVSGEGKTIKAAITDCIADIQNELSE